MFEKEFHISELIARYMRGSLTSQEQDELDDWLNASDENTVFFNALLKEDFNDKLKKYFSVDKEALWKMTKDKISGSGARPIKNKFVKIRSLSYRIGIAASILIMLSVAIYYYTMIVKKPLNETVIAANDIPPGKMGATLTLANGKKIDLTKASNGELAKEAGISVIKSAQGQLMYSLPSLANQAKEVYNTLSTEKGETYILILPDKSKVWMNAASSLTYLASLNSNGNRVVKLKGEAYFEVVKDKKHPFIVETADQKIKVLGTHFNVNAYTEQKDTRTTLLEGAVRVSAFDKTQVLKPGEQASFDGNKILKSKADTAVAVAWKNGYFNFVDTELSEVLQQLSRWYNVDIKYQGKVPAETFTGYIKRNYTLSEVLEILKYMKINFKIKNKTIIVGN